MSDTRPVIAATMDEWPPFDLLEEPLPGGLVITVEGELDMATAPALRERLTVATAAGATALVLDLRRITFMDSIGLRSCTRAAGSAPGGGWRSCSTAIRTRSSCSRPRVFPDRSRCSPPGRRQPRS